MRICLAQYAPGLDPAENRIALTRHVATDVDLVVLPEGAARDFGTPGSPCAYAETLDGPFVSSLVALASRGATVVAGMFEKSDDASRPYNTVVAVNKDGVVASYRKIHLYDSFGYRESDVLLPGSVDQRPIVEVVGTRVGLAICYDLRFPELMRPMATEVDLMVLPAAWVAGPRKVGHWRTLLAARAIENVCYVAGVDQPGPRYAGNSLLVDPRGEIVAELGESEGSVRAEVDPALVTQARTENPSLDNRRL
ncbi:MAG: carbon-nitrogen hydrolase family protein [Nocardioidaceae bacterium]|nr:MAG: carbon-nitrogen hydrolase family protein [Nocardioidaceae bacterium]